MGDSCANSDWQKLCLQPAQKRPEAPQLTVPGSHDVSHSCVTCCRASVSSTRPHPTTNVVKITLRSQRHIPFGHWSTQTFIAALRHDWLDAHLGDQRDNEPGARGDTRCCAPRRSRQRYVASTISCTPGAPAVRRPAPRRSGHSPGCTGSGAQASFPSAARPAHRSRPHHP